MTSAPSRLAALATGLALLAAVATVGAVTAASPTRHVNAEKFALKLVNCTRTGGWVEADGSCTARGTGEHSAWVKPLQRHKGISRKVAWPWARALVNHEACGHTIAGKPDLGKRLRSRGFTYPYYGENVGCAWGLSARQMVIATHRAMQAEMETNGGHWRNMKDGGFKSVGIGVAKLGGMTAVVYDFYGKAAP